jgi:hypothetical protein
MRLTLDWCVVVTKGYNRLVVLNVFVIVFLGFAIVIVLVTYNVGDAAATTAPIHYLLANEAFGIISVRGRVVRTSGSGGVEAALVSSPKHGDWSKHRSRRDEAEVLIVIVLSASASRSRAKLVVLILNFGASR